MTVSYDALLVGLSVVIAIFAAYTCFHLTHRMRLVEGTKWKLFLAGAAVTMGGGIWSMHFVGMLAFSLPVAVSYDVLLTLISALVSVIMTGVGLVFVGTGRVSPVRAAGGGLFMGLGIATMHYLGMMAVRADAVMSYNAAIVALSIVIGVVAATLALWLAFRLRVDRHRAVGAVVMGLAVSGMHYTAMLAMRFEPVAEAVGFASPAIDSSLLAIIISLATFLIFGVALLSALPDGVTASKPGAAARDAAADSAETGAAEFRDRGPVREAVQEPVRAPLPRLVKLPVVKDNKKVLIDLDRVESVQANAHYTTVYADGGAFFCDLSLSDLERRLDPAQFVRVHRSHMVNVRYAKAFERHNEQAVLVIGGVDERRIPVSRGKVRLLRDPLGI